MRRTWKSLYDLKHHTGHFYRHRNRCQICLMFWVCQSITLASPRESYKEPCLLCIQGCLARHFMTLSLSVSPWQLLSLNNSDPCWHAPETPDTADISLHHHQTDHNPPIIKTFSTQNSYSLMSQPAVLPVHYDSPRQYLCKILAIIQIWRRTEMWKYFADALSPLQNDN